MLCVSRQKTSTFHTHTNSIVQQVIPNTCSFKYILLQWYFCLAWFQTLQCFKLTSWPYMKCRKNIKIEDISGNSQETGPIAEKRKMTERAKGVERITRKQVGKWNQMIGLRFQTGNGHQTSRSMVISAFHKNNDDDSLKLRPLKFLMYKLDIKMHTSKSKIKLEVSIHV